MKQDRFHGRVRESRRPCDWPGCAEAGEFRAPGARGPSFDGPGQYRWFCLDHVRQFNAGYDWFEGMSAEEILAAQHPIHGWDRQTRAFSPTAGIDAAPRWADFKDPLEAISGRASSGIEEEWTEDEEHYQGIDDANRAYQNANQLYRSRKASLTGNAPSNNGPSRSVVFLNITRPYTDAASARVAEFTVGLNVRKVIYVPGKLVNIVAN